MDWRQGSYINQYYNKLSGRSLVEDIEMYMVDNFQGRWYDNILILELKFKLLNESKNYYKALTDDQRFLRSEKVVNNMVNTYNNHRYRDVEEHVAYCIEQHKERIQIYGGYGHYGYIRHTPLAIR